MKVSVIDLGFNSVKMVNYDVKKDGTFRAYQQEGVKVRLGEDLHQTGYLGKEPVQRTVEALKLFRDIINFDSIRHVLPVATSAVREAGNREDFLRHVYGQTGFQFRVLSGQEEAIYSYIGALRSTCIPTALFFDIGGGSLELVYTENYAIKKVRSYPLGALRLTQMYGRKDGTFSKKDYGKMVRKVLSALPDRRKDFDMSPDTTLVGVGGALRAMARYDQEAAGYELDKIHNYRMEYADISAMAREFYRMDAEELAAVKAIGSNRVETIAAGAAVISLLMQKMDFDKVVVSAQGLREGILSVFVRDPKAFYRREGIASERAKTYVTYACQLEILPEHTVTLVRPLLSAGLLREKEKVILTHAIKQTGGLSAATTNLNNLFYMMMDEDNPFLSHREQLILALSIVYTRKGKAADWLFSRYRSILEPQNRKSIEKIAACLVLSAILEKAKANVRMSVGNVRGGRRKIDMKIMPARQFVPQILLANAVKNLEDAFGVSVSCSIAFNNSNSNGKARHPAASAAVIKIRGRAATS